MSGSGEVIFRQRHCHARNCGAVFYICRCCDRGHGYCSDHCRQTSRRQQLREANRKFELRFRAIEQTPGFGEKSLEEKEELWTAVKKAQADASA